MNSPNTTSTEPRHPIQVVARRSGLTPDVLRAWEKRYGVVVPGRSTGGRRLYSDFDIDRLVLLREATEAGRRIGDVARLDTEQLEALVREDREAQSAIRDRPESAGEVTPVARFLDQCLTAVQALDVQALEATLERAVFVFSPVTLVDELVGPLMARIGERWVHGQLSPSHEHMATSVVRQTLAKLTGMLRPEVGAPKILIATPARQRHEVGAALAACAAAAGGWEVVYLGADLPAGEIAGAAKRLGVDAVALSIVHPADDPDLDGELRQLRRTLGSGISLLVGGRAARAYRRTLQEIDAVLISDIATFRSALVALADRNGRRDPGGPAR